MEKFSNGLSDAESERLALLIEEAAEVQQIAGKILRHGFESYNPDLLVNQGTGEKYTNRQMLEKEIAHFNVAVARMKASRDLDIDNINLQERRKKDTGAKYLHHQPDSPEYMQWKF